jgi:DNA-binding response OmpR family regulator
MDVWIIEDEQKVLDNLDETMSTAGFSVHRSGKIEEMLEVVEKRPYSPDVIVMDRMLQEADALDHLSDVRTTFPSAKVLVLSAINSSTEKAFALDCGADDYMSKPFSNIELVARVRALARRNADGSFDLLRLGNLSIDREARVATVGDKKFPLTNKEYLVLKTLIQNPGKVFTKDELFGSVWDLTERGETNVLAATITNLRRKLEEHEANIQIRNLRNAGYWVEA